MILFFCQGITVHSPSIVASAGSHGYPVVQDGDKHVLTSPDGHKFNVVNKEVNGGNIFDCFMLYIIIGPNFCLIPEIEHIRLNIIFRRHLLVRTLHALNRRSLC